MQEQEKAAQLLKAAADHIQAHGMLWGDWASQDTSLLFIDEPDDRQPCCCAIGTLRWVADVNPRTGTDEKPEALALAIAGLEEVTEDERAEMAETEPVSLRCLTDAGRAVVDMVDWSDEFADVEWTAKRGRLKRDEGNRRHAVAMFRQAAEAMGGTPWN